MEDIRKKRYKKMLEERKNIKFEDTVLGEEAKKIRKMNQKALDLIAKKSNI